MQEGGVTQVTNPLAKMARHDNGQGVVPVAEGSSPSGRAVHAPHRRQFEPQQVKAPPVGHMGVGLQPEGGTLPVQAIDG